MAPPTAREWLRHATHRKGSLGSLLICIATGIGVGIVLRATVRDLMARVEAQRAWYLQMVMEAIYATWEGSWKPRCEGQRRKEEEAAKKEQEELEEQRRRGAKEEAEQRKADEEIYARIKKQEEVCAAVALQRCRAKDRQHWDSWLLG